MSQWGLLPDTVRERLKQLEWDNIAHRRDRLKGKRTGAMRVSLRAPTGKQALADLSHLHEFVNAWQKWPDQSQLTWETRRFAQIGPTRVPVKLTLTRIQELIQLLGPGVRKQTQQWESIMAPLLSIDARFYPALVDHLSTLEQMTLSDSERLASLLSQLIPNCGDGLYLRALPLNGVHTKFVEDHAPLLIALLDVQHDNAVTQAGGLYAWLGCKQNPKNWITVRLLFAEARQHYGQVDILQLDTDTVQRTPLPGSRIIIVENLQSSLSLSDIPETLAITSGGNNLSWLGAKWLCDRDLVYWGDIDSWGLTILSRARALQPNIRSVMMDQRTVERFIDQMVDEPTARGAMPANLTETEAQLFEALVSGRYPGGRLEQEKLSQDYIVECLTTP